MGIFNFKPVQAVFLRTGESDSKEISLKSCLSTVLHIKLWYESDFIERSGFRSQDLYSVTKMHAAKIMVKAKPQAIPSQKQQKILSAIRQQLESVDTGTDAQLKAILNHDDPDLPVSQSDMVIMQFCCTGFVILFPPKFGTTDTK